MNKQIKEQITNVKTDTSGRWVSIDELEKFAELIVRECATLAYDGPGGILEHFGVKE